MTMNKKIIFSVLALPLSALLGFIIFVGILAIMSFVSGDPNYLHNVRTNEAQKTTMVYVLFGSVLVVYLLSAFFIWKRKSEATNVQATPWNYFAVFIMSSLFGPGAGFLVTWQNLLRMGKVEEAKKFLMLGGLAFLAMCVALLFIPSDGAKVLGNIASMAFPVWLYYTNQKQWQLDNPNKAKFSWSILGWSLLGVSLLFIVVILLGFIIHK